MTASHPTCGRRLTAFSNLSAALITPKRLAMAGGLAVQVFAMVLGRIHLALVIE